VLRAMATLQLVRGEALLIIVVPAYVRNSIRERSKEGINSDNKEV
jgi:hypothetical protein